MTLSVARRMWELLETYHAVVYFAPDAKEIYSRAGLKGGWMGYFASRSAAFGPASPELVAATFYNFHPAMVARSLPDAWHFSTPEAVIDARLQVADSALRTLLGPELEAEALSTAASIALAAVDASPAGGRPLFAAHARLQPPDEPHLQLWHATTCLREFRGDGHVNALVLHSIDGCEANVLMAASGRFEADTQRSFRGWSDEEWSAAESRLRERELLDSAGGLTERGQALRASVERQTDVLSSLPWEALGPEATARLAEILTRLDRVIVANDGVPFPNPMGLPLPEGLAG